MAEITKETTILNIKNVLKAFMKKVEEAKNYIDFLPLEGREIVDDYDSNKDKTKDLLNESITKENFFEGLTNEELIDYANTCCELNEQFDLRVRNLCKVTKIKTDGLYKLICESGSSVSQPGILNFKIVKINNESVNLLTTNICRIDWQLLDSEEHIIDDMSFKDFMDVNYFTRSIEFRGKGRFIVRAKLYTIGVIKDTITDILDYKQTIIGKEIDLSLYDKSWIVVKNEDGTIEKIIFNEGNGITFVNRYGQVIEKVPFDVTYTKTEFLNKNLKINNTNELLAKAHYKYNKEKGLFEEGKEALRCFNLHGNAAPYEFDVITNNKTENNSSLEKELLKNNKKVKEEKIPVVFNEELSKLNDNNISENHKKSVSNRVYQNDLRPENPNGPCLFRSLIAAVEEKINKPFTLNELNRIKQECAKTENKYIGNSSEEFFVNKHAEVIEVALEIAGYKNSSVKWTSQRKTTVSGNSDYTIRYIASKGHFQLGDKDGNLLWDPYKYNNEANAFKGKATSFNEIIITLGSK